MKSIDQSENMKYRLITSPDSGHWTNSSVSTTYLHLGPDLDLVFSQKNTYMSSVQLNVRPYKDWYFTLLASGDQSFDAQTWVLWTTTLETRWCVNKWTSRLINKPYPFQEKIGRIKLISIVNLDYKESYWNVTVHYPD